MDKVPVYVLVTLGIGNSGEVTRKNVGVTFNLYDAETHAHADVANEYETHGVNGDFPQDIEVSAMASAIRDFRGMVEEIQAESLR